MTTATGQRRRPVLIIVTAAVLLGVATTAALAATGLGRPGRPWLNAPSCATPALTGTVVDVTLTDMGAMMGPGMMMGPGSNGLYVGNGYLGARGDRWPGMTTMRIVLNPGTVPAGVVSFRAINTGALIHEVTVLPLGPGQSPGQRAVGSDGQVDESTALGHAARTCGEGDGDGITPGAAGWTTITLPPGRYEVLCNIAGHYWAGMYTELDVTANR